MFSFRRSFKNMVGFGLILGFVVFFLYLLWLVAPRSYSHNQPPVRVMVSPREARPLLKFPPPTDQEVARLKTPPVPTVVITPIRSGCATAVSNTPVIGPASSDASRGAHSKTAAEPDVSDDDKQAEPSLSKSKRPTCMDTRTELAPHATESIKQE